jgi:hypothetical protein
MEAAVDGSQVSLSHLVSGRKVTRCDVMHVLTDATQPPDEWCGHGVMRVLGWCSTAAYDET